ncbi:MAG: ABC transporter permease [Bacteroidaceae bacterium]|nr:ABC transporter permease [Bacteroidaceae bacterium]
MIIHYLKVALRSLWKYRAHSLISVICLAVGITFFAVMSMYVSRIGFYRDQPDYERRVFIKKEKGWISEKDWELLKNIPLPELDSLAVTSCYSSKAEIGIIDHNQHEMPYMVQYKEVNGRSFTDFAMKRVSGDTRMLKQDEVVISRDFARRIFGNSDPLGMILHWIPLKNGEIEYYRIVGVVDGFLPINGDMSKSDIYFPLTAFNDRQSLYIESVLKPGFDIHCLNERLRKIQLDPGDENSTLVAYSTMSRYEGSVWMEAMGYFIAALVLISSIVNFLKFVIQMFYNRQRELAIRKCVGSGTLGTFCLLFAECFCMMSMALFLSFCISEISYTFIMYYTPEQVGNFLNQTDIYIISLKVYLVLLAVCMLIILWPVWKLRQTSIIRMVMVGTRRHVFRNVMIGFQMAISLFFLGATCVIGLFINEEREGIDYLSEDEIEHTIVMDVSSVRLSKNITAVLADIEALPEVTKQTTMMHAVERINMLDYPGSDGGFVRALRGSATYFDFFQIPMEGKVMSDEEGHEQWAYVSRDLQKQMQKDGIEGSIHIDNRDYQIAGVYDQLYKEGKDKRSVGSIFICNKFQGTCYFRIHSHSDVYMAMEKIKAVCRKYVPETLPLDVRLFTDKRNTLEGIKDTFFYGFLIMAFISMLVVSLSIYSAISMDTVSRQKEVAIRKINGATPKIIAWMFGRTYIITYLIVFLLVYPLSRAILIMELGGEYIVPYRWDWPLLIFFGIAFLIFVVTAFKIYQIMHINPAAIIKKE